MTPIRPAAGMDMVFATVGSVHLPKSKRWSTARSFARWACASVPVTPPKSKPAPQRLALAYADYLAAGGGLQLSPAALGAHGLSVDG